ncbi:peptidoglycan D,D-transpeptidase FtsI family protein [Sulfobacillus thermosulfidooxidans]|uniref:peptidoglycan D,D-transpeptidase FtsI family protein n=1 Tax=Sulfobacillus thermosulfidooxidans TaxID=28034 RepID=UPI0006B50AD1|nr:penicillin-binding protein 2 [Sulfobacillus thermosulfidooxidans]
MKTRRSVQWRALWTLIFTAVFMLVLIIRLVIIQIADASSLQAYARNIHVHKIILPAPRGKIIDRNGTILAMDVPTYQIVAAPKYVTHPGQEAAILAKYLPFSQSLLKKVLSNNSWYALLDRSVPQSLATKIQQLNLTGISVIPSSGQEYPNGTLASQVIGMVGANGQGLAGIEYEDNKILSGKPGYWIVRTDASGNPLPQWQEAYKAPKPGDTVQLTIDANIEAVAQKWLKWGVKRAHALNGTVIILNPHTGSVIALANWPNFNPNNYYSATPLEMTDYAVQDPVPPGSIFKPVTASAGLGLGLFTPNSMFDTRGYKIVDGVRINDWNPVGWGWITLTRGLEVSSDQVFMDVALKVGVDGMYHYIKEFGLDHPSNVGLPGDSSGIWIPKNQVNAVDLATIGFGQGMAVTPMQMITADSAIPNHGVMMQPHILKAILSPTGQVIKTVKPQVESRPDTPKVAKEIEHMMVLEATQGTGVPAQVPGYVIGGKTGTAQKIVDGKTSSNLFVSSYMGFGPVPHPRFIMLVMINRPIGKLFYGDQVSAPVWQHIASYLFKYWKIKPYAGPDNGSKPFVKP